MLVDRVRQAELGCRLRSGIWGRGGEGAREGTGERAGRDETESPDERLDEGETSSRVNQWQEVECRRAFMSP